MKTLKVKSILFSLLAMMVVAVFLTSCEQEHVPDITESPRFEALDKVFTDYQVVTIANDELLALAQNNKEEGFIVNLMIPQKPDWSFSVQFHDFYAEDYKAYESDANGNWIEVANTDRNDAFHGQSLDKESMAMFIMEKDRFSAEIYENDAQYGLEPLTVYIPTASPDQYVYYRLEADIIGNQMECGNVTGNHIENTPSGIETRLNQCRDMSICYVADYEYYDDKCNGSASYARSYIEGRLMYGSYRYWAYNDYPLYFKLFDSYIKTNTSNRPATSADRATFVSQWKDWGNAGNITERDANLLYTGRNFPGLYGRVYQIGAVCKDDNNGEKTAYSMVTRLDGTSSHVYNKVTAHEVGHLLGAYHKTSGFMKQGTHSSTTMPQATRNEFDAYISNNNGCMPLRTCVNYDD